MREMEITSEDYQYNGFTIRIRKSKIEPCYDYLIYLISNGKWKRIRGMTGYKDGSDALEKAKSYLDEYGHRHIITATV